MNTMPPAARTPGSPPPSKGGSNAALVGLAGIALGFVVGYGIGRVSTGTPINPRTGQKGGYEEGYAAGVKKIKDSGLLPPALTEALSLSGTVTDVAAGRLTFEADLRMYDPAGSSGLPTSRVATVTGKTEIIRLERKSTEEEAADQAAFADAMRDPDPATPPRPPSPMKETTISLDDLKVGDAITVIADSDILKSAAFEALRIVLSAPTIQEQEVPDQIEPPPQP